MSESLIICKCRADIFPNSRQEEVTGRFQNGNFPVFIIDDLCAEALEPQLHLKEIFENSSRIHIVACRKRSVTRLLHFAGADFSNKPMEFYSLLETSTDEIFSQIEANIKKEQKNYQAILFESNFRKPSWYPVIDYTRCSDCGQCADFCLFGVYARNPVRVVNPSGCKNNCPACARICPHAAIIFPKYKHGGAIAGSDYVDEAQEQQRQARDINEILGNDIYKGLEARKAKRQSAIRADFLDKALSEREKALRESENNKINEQ